MYSESTRPEMVRSNPFSQPTPSRSIFSTMMFVILTIVFVAVPATAQTYTVLHAFNGTDGSGPSAVVRDAQGNLFGTTWNGLSNVFKLDPAGNLTVLFTFPDLTDGFSAFGGVIVDGAGNLYGTTFSGGDLSCGGGFGCGVVYKLDPSGNETVLHNFTDNPDGYGGATALLRDANGNLYGTTRQGGRFGIGTIFRVKPDGTESVLHSFSIGIDGRVPEDGLVADAAGNLYGTAGEGGTCRQGNGCGMLFKLNLNGTYTILYQFEGQINNNDGKLPSGSVAVDAFGNVYGTTRRGGRFDQGTVFKVNGFGQETILHHFNGGSDGGDPVAGLIRDAKGNLYGTTQEDGAFGAGTVFQLGPAGKFTVLYAFTGGADGGFPETNLIMDPAGNLYGTTLFGGEGFGVVFKLTP